jgi:hypothetical protein
MLVYQRVCLKIGDTPLLFNGKTHMIFPHMILRWAAYVQNKPIRLDLSVILEMLFDHMA